jgi:heptosyltransferase-2
MSLAALRALRERFPEAWIAVQARPWVADLYAGQRFLDQVVLYTARRGAGDWSGKWSAAQELRSARFDCAILLAKSFDAALVVRLAGIPRRIGYNRDGRGWLLTDAIRPPVAGEIPRHERFHYLELLRRAGMLETLPEGDVRLEGAGASSPAAPVIGVSPGAAYGGAKRWLPERFAEAALRIAAEMGGSVAVFGSAGERETAELVVKLVVAGGVAARNFAGETSLRQFIDLVSACRVFLTNDSGSMHIASALGVPTVAVFGATDHETTGPSGPLSRVVREPVECSPCLLRECPIDHRCMTRVSAERVAAEALNLLK